MEYTMKCACCGKIFIAHRKDNIYCSKKCKDVGYKRSKGQDSRIDPYHRICVECGTEFDTLNPSKITCSDKCSEEHRKKRGRKSYSIEEYVLIRKQQAQERRNTKQIEKLWYKAIHTEERECKICGALFYCLDKETKCTCSQKCSKENARRQKNRRADKRLNSTNIVDTDITLEKLYKRDNGICYLCGDVCDWNDYYLKNGIKICGHKYPSKDHVVPLALGGKHSWENVRLAHLKCNIEKSDTTPTYTKEMSREHARKLASEKTKNKKKTAQYKLNGELVKIWESTAQIKRELGLSDKHIQNVCREAKTGNAYGFHWEYISV